MAQDVSIGMLNTPMRASDSHRCFYNEPGDRRAEAFRALNGLGDGQQILSPGRMLLVPHSAAASPSDAARMEKLAGTTRRASPVTASPIQAATFNEDFDLLDALTQHRGAVDFASAQVDGLSTYLQKRISLIEGDLRKLEDSYRVALKRGLPLNSPEARKLRQPIEDALKRQINGMSRKYILRAARATDIKSGLGLSHKSIAKSFRLDGDLAKNKRIEQAVSRNAAFAAKLKPIGTFGKILNAGAMIGEVNAGYEKQGVAGAVMAVGKEASGFLGARAGSAMAVTGATSVMLLFGVATGGVGFAVIGIAAVAGGIAGNRLGEGIYEVATENLGQMIARVADD